MVVLPLVVWAALGSGDGSGQAADGKAAKSPAAGTDSATTDPSWIGAEDSQGTLRGRLHNVASGLCIGIAGTKAVEGAEAVLATCSATPGQQWSYEPDGLLRSAADADLCLDSHLGYSVRLAPCAGAGRSDVRNVRYDFTLQGTLVPRSGQDLALAPAATDGSGALVLKNREDGSQQRWVIDTSQPDAQMQYVNWGADSSPSATPAPTPEASKTPSPAARTPKSAPTTPAPTGSSATDSTSCSYVNRYTCEPNGDGHGYGDYGYGDGYDGGYGYGGGYGGSGSGGGRH